MKTTLRQAKERLNHSRWKANQILPNGTVIESTFILTTPSHWSRLPQSQDAAWTVRHVNGQTVAWRIFG